MAFSSPVVRSRRRCASVRFLLHILFILLVCHSCKVRTDLLPFTLTGTFLRSRVSTYTSLGSVDPGGVLTSYFYSSPFSNPSVILVLQTGSARHDRDDGTKRSGIVAVRRNTRYPLTLKDATPPYQVCQKH